MQSSRIMYKCWPWFWIKPYLFVYIKCKEKKKKTFHLAIGCWKTKLNIMNKIHLIIETKRRGGFTRLIITTVTRLLTPQVGIRHVDQILIVQIVWEWYRSNNLVFILSHLFSTYWNFIGWNINWKIDWKKKKTKWID
jgi:hypothetical protein